MQSGSLVIDLLLNYVTLTVAIVMLASSILILVTKRKTISRGWRIALIVLLAIITLYLLFVINVVVAFSSGLPFAYP